MRRTCGASWVLAARYEGWASATCCGCCVGRRCPSRIWLRSGLRASRSRRSLPPAGTTAFPRGGMGALTQAIAQAATRAGAEIRTNAEVARVIVKDGAASGVVLANGEEIAARAVV